MSNDFESPNQQINKELKCHDCGALLLYAPGTQKLACKYCGAQNDIPTETKSYAQVREINFHDYITHQISKEEKQTVSTVSCSNCGATTTLKPNVTSDSCAFCASPLVISGGTVSTIIKPDYILPFKVDNNNAKSSFSEWLGGLWFAPNDLKRYATLQDKIKGIYMPYWTYDAQSTCEYVGERGEYYYVGDGNNRKRETRWYDVQGVVTNTFDDVFVIASHSLPDSTTRDLEPWDFKNYTDYNDAYLSGFQAECYQTDVENGFETAKEVMKNQLRALAMQQIGGDDQRISNMHIQHNDVTFKHVLLPIWISAYQYNNKVYRFIINGRSGKVVGERPYSWIKIALAVLAALMLIGFIASLRS